MEEKDWRLLVALAEQRSMTRAAEHLYITQPAATRRVQQLENELGCTLMLRSHSGVELTSEGEAVCRYAAAQIEELEKLRCALQERGEQVRGTLRLACANAYARSRLASLLQEFSRRQPLVEVHVVTGHSNEMLRRLASGEAQMAVVRGEFHWSEAETELDADPCYYVTSVSPLSMEELPAAPQIRIVTDPSLQLDIDRWWTAHYRRPPRVVAVVDRSDVCIEMVRRGLGYSLLSGLYLEGYPDLYRHRIASETVRRRTRACCRSDALRLRAVRAFWDFLNETAAKKPTHA